MSEDLIARLKAAHAAATEMRIDTGPDPVYEGTPESEEAYYEWQRVAWENSAEIIAALEERERFQTEARAIIKRFWLTEFYGEFPEDRSTLDLIEWMSVWNGKAHSGLKLVNESVRRRDEERERMRHALQHIYAWTTHWKAEGRNQLRNTMRLVYEKAEAALDALEGTTSDE